MDRPGGGRWKQRSEDGLFKWTSNDGCVRVTGLQQAFDILSISSKNGKQNGVREAKKQVRADASAEVEYGNDGKTHATIFQSQGQFNMPTEVRLVYSTVCIEVMNELINNKRVRILV